MTQLELSAFMDNFYGRWPSYKRSQERDQKLWAMFGQYAQDRCLKAVAEWDLGHPDAIRPSLGEIRTAVLAGYGENDEATYLWSAADEAELAQVYHLHFDRRGLERPPIETIGTTFLSKARGPTIAERNRTLAIMRKLGAKTPTEIEQQQIDNNASFDAHRAKKAEHEAAEKAGQRVPIDPKRAAAALRRGKLPAGMGNAFGVDAEVDPGDFKQKQIVALAEAGDPPPVHDEEIPF